LVPPVKVQLRPGKTLEKMKVQNQEKVFTAFDKFIAGIEKGSRDKPPLDMLIPFRIFKYISEIDRDNMPSDYGYYKDKTEYYYDIKIPFYKKFISGKVVADVGAGSGILAFLLAKYAETVYAIEPISAFRAYIREKAARLNCRNVYAVDGFPESIPFPDNSFDILFISNAIGWNIEKELQEIERVVKPNGQAIHIMRVNEEVTENPVHGILISEKWNYTFSKMQESNKMKLKYIKTII
jgi:SAM-dependent methyltransferase